MGKIKRFVFLFACGLLALVLTGCGDSSPTSPTGPTGLTVIYDGNGATGGTAPEDATSYATGATVTVLDNVSLVKTGKTFAGWLVAGGSVALTYTAGTRFTIEKATTLSAIWADTVVVISYEIGGETKVSQTVAAGATTLVLPQKPTKEGYTFLGWALDAEATTPTYTADAEIAVGSSNLALYPVWKSTTTPTDPTTPTETSAQGVTATVSYPSDASITLTGTTSVAKGGSLQITVTETFDSYRWYLDGKDAGKTGNPVTLETTGLTAGNHRLTVIASNGAGVFSADLTITISN